jgi:hypothetical protein
MVQAAATRSGEDGLKAQTLPSVQDPNHNNLDRPTARTTVSPHPPSSGSASSPIIRSLV